MSIPLEKPEGDTLSFELKARPISLQGNADSKKELKQQVLDQISGAKFLFSGEVEAVITLQVHERERYEGVSSPDVDNVLKPLLDALSGPAGILVNDCQVQSVRCSWVDWTRTDHNLIFDIRHEPDAWILKQDLVWVEISKSLCMPLNTSAPRKALELMLNTWTRMFAARDELLALGNDYYTALQVMPVQRAFHSARLNGFRVISLAEAQQLTRG